MPIVKTSTVFENVEEWVKSEVKVYPSHCFVPISRKYGDGRKVIVLILGGNNGTSKQVEKKK